MPEGLTGHHAELLQKVDLFAGLDRMALAQLAAFVEPVAVEEGGVVFRQGEPGDALYIVARGKFGVFVSLPDAPTEVRLTTLAPGDVFGSIAATLTRRLSANARIILQSEHVIVSVVDQALGRLDPKRRRRLSRGSLRKSHLQERSLPMTDARTAVADLLDGTLARVQRVLTEISEEDARRRPQDLAPIVWQVGHITLSDARALMRGGVPVEIPSSYPTLFDTGTGGEADYPSLAALLPLMTEINAHLRRLALEADLAKTVEGSRTYKTVGEALAFLLYHRGYHIGKMATLRALLGKQRVFG